MGKEVFSEFELRAMGFKIGDEENYSPVNCVGSSEETMNTKIIKKKCRGVVAKEVVKGDGTGTLKITAHIPYEVYTKMYGMTLDGLVSGVQAYGQKSVHKNMSIVQDVYDEDGNEKLKAYPNCILETGVSRKIENGAEEVAELELEIAIMPDDDGNGMYEVIVTDLGSGKENVKNQWMTAFGPELVKEEE